MIAHSGGCSRTIRNVDCIHAYRLEKPRSFQFLANLDTLRRNDLDHRDKVAFANFEPRFERFAIGDCGSAVLTDETATDGGDDVLTRASPMRKRRLHRTNMLRRCSAATAHQTYSCRHELARVARHVFRRAQINISTLNRTWHACVWLRCQRKGSRCSHALDSHRASRLGPRCNYIQQRPRPSP